jgi:hypothetical protein
MPKFQAVNVKPLAGISKGSGRPYNMVAVSGIFTDDQGEMHVGEIVFMEGNNRPLPVIVPGQSYTPIMGARARDGKLQFEITELKPVKVDARPLSSAAA